MNNNESEWEFVNASIHEKTNETIDTMRLKVKNGWIYRFYERVLVIDQAHNNAIIDIKTNFVFVPDFN